MTCAYRVSVRVSHHRSEVLVGSLYSQLVVLAISLRHPPGSMTSLSHLFSAGRSHQHGRVIRMHSSEPLLLSWRYTNLAPANATSDMHEAKSHIKCRRDRLGLVHSQHLSSYRSQGAYSGYSWCLFSLKPMNNQRSAVCRESPLLHLWKLFGKLSLLVLHPVSQQNPWS